MEKEKSNPVEKEIDRDILVVSDLPKEPMRTFTSDGKEYGLITFDEALREILIKIRKIEKSVV